MRNLLLGSCLSAITIVSLNPQLAKAQDADGQPAATPAQADEPGILDAIIVTANKRAENLQDVPISVSAFSGDQLTALGVTDTTGITQQIPALQVNQWSPNLTIFNLRGVSQNNFTDNLEAPVAVYFDNAYMGSINGVSGQIFDVERVEVLRGPQGTLFGRNATGGLIHYLSRQAEEDNLNGYIEASYGRFNDLSIEAAMGGGIAEGVRIRAAGRLEKADGYVISRDTDAAAGLVGSGQDLGGKDGWAGRITMQFEVTPDLTANLWYKHAQDNDVDTGGYVFDNCDFLANGYCAVDDTGLGNGQGGVINGITGEPASPFENFGERRGYLDRNVDIYQADFEWDLGDALTLTSITNYTDLSKTYGEDGDAIPVLVINFDTTNDYRQFSHEMRLAGDTDFARWQVGGYYLDIDMDGSIKTQGAPVLGSALEVNGDAVDPAVFQTFGLSSRNWSVFGQADFLLTDTLTLTAGARYSQDDKSIDYTATLIDPAVADDFLIASSAAFETVVPGVNDIDYGDWAARVALSYEPNPDLLLFASWNRGIKGGNWSLGSDVVAEDFKHGAETLNSFEAGFKSTLANGDLRLNGTVFHYIFDDYQAFALTGGVPFVTNSDARSTGAEVEAYWSPTPQLNVVLGGTWQTSKVDQVRGPGEQFGPEFFPGAPDAQFCTNEGGFFFCDYPQDFITDAEFPNSPEFSLNYLFRYNFDLGGGELAAQVDGAWYADQYLEVTNGLSSLQEAYNVTNTSLMYTDDASGISAQLWMRNVFDKEYRAYTLNLGILGTTSFFAPPRTYGATLRIPFGD
ncbi:TonB-dependent receptor [Aurantiacibacter rhizosphaerae]|uniref:TonB-dependent receptor n=1 Tax=Aurantiacibacter rhizosphaerae TaxID=2691582 RepID=A0A844XCI2_9SPHN|nr:TonB-dependent receptor [Aurantiacibacter rhizosphaerae]MWV27540.1 TonB-dependent receptor [Aurantiacibacter rhizosphaerae]